MIVDVTNLKYAQSLTYSTKPVLENDNEKCQQQTKNFTCISYMPRSEKPGFCICENKATDQLFVNCTTNQRLCFHYMDSTTPLLHKSEISSHLAIFCDCTCTAWFVSDLVGNPEHRSLRTRLTYA